MKPDNPWYTVSRGRFIGAYGSWASVLRVIENIPGAAVKAYINRVAAEASLADVQNRNLTRQLGIAGEPHTLSPPRDVIPATVPSSDLPMHLSGAVAVFRGLQTGVFEDWLHCAPFVLNSSGVIPGASFMTYYNMDDASYALTKAYEAHHVFTIHP